MTRTPPLSAPVSSPWSPARSSQLQVAQQVPSCPRHRTDVPTAAHRTDTTASAESISAADRPFSTACYGNAVAFQNEQMLPIPDGADKRPIDPFVEPKGLLE